MALIDNEEAARRLARVIISDIELYEKKKLQAGDDLTAPMAEGRALFHRRVVPELAAIFEVIVEAKRSGTSTGGPSAFTPSPLGMPPRPSAPAEQVERTGGAEEPERPRAGLVASGAPEPEADVTQARVDDARPVEAVLSESTARTDLTAEAAASRNPDLPTGRMQAIDARRDDQITPVQLEGIVAGRPETRESPAAAAGARRSEAPDEDTSQDERVTSPVGFAAVTTAPEEPPIAARPPASPPAHTPAPSRAPGAASPAASLAATPSSLGLTKAQTPQPIAVRREPPPIPRDAADKTPVPLSVSLAALAVAPSVRPPAVPSLAASPVGGLATVPPEALVAPPVASGSAVTEDVVNLRAKTSKVRVFLYIVATAGGLALIGRFLTRFL